MVHCYGVIPYTTRLSQEIQYLCIKQHNSESWSFPKGHADPDESILDTALRELHEEVGIRVQVVPDFSYAYSYRIRRPQVPFGNTKTVTLFLGRTCSTVVSVQHAEIEDAMWLTAEQAYARINFPSIREALVHAQQFLQKMTV